MKLTICGIFFDGYYDLWEDFLELFYSNWDQCPYELHIINNEKELEFDKKYPVHIHHAGKDAEYSKKVQYMVEHIDSEYYLLLLDDFFLGKKLDKNALDLVLKTIEAQKMKYLALPLDEFKDSYKGKKHSYQISTREISSKAEYTVSCQAAIWERSFLKECIGTMNYNAWIFEGVYAKASFAHTKEFLKGCYVNTENILCLKHGALQGKMLPTTMAYYDSIGYSMHNKREVLDPKVYHKHERKSKIKNMVPLWIQKFIKKHFKTSSVLERYNTQIQEVILDLEAKRK